MTWFKKRWLYIAAVIAALLQSGVMLAGVQQRASILRNGTEVVLRSLPVDPRDLMRGDYVTLSYDMSNLPVKLIRGEPPYKSGLNYVYVVMTKHPDGAWRVTRAQFDMPDALQDNEIFVRGELDAPIMAYSDNATVAVVYGIERYYVPEGEGLVIEKAQFANKTDIVLAVNAKGVAAIRAIRIDGKTLYDEPMF